MLLQTLKTLQIENQIFYHSLQQNGHYGSIGQFVCICILEMQLHIRDFGENYSTKLIVKETNSLFQIWPLLMVPNCQRSGSLEESVSVECSLKPLTKVGCKDSLQ
jgi:hypothetical protein